jgi:putative methionine-R-sulfoxide reductase with GAF domain
MAGLSISLYTVYEEKESLKKEYSAQQEILKKEFNELIAKHKRSQTIATTSIALSEQYAKESSFLGVYTVQLLFEFGNMIIESQTGDLKGVIRRYEAEVGKIREANAPGVRKLMEDTKRLRADHEKAMKDESTTSQTF